MYLGYFYLGITAFTGVVWFTCFSYLFFAVHIVYKLILQQKNKGKSEDNKASVSFRKVVQASLILSIPLTAYAVFYDYSREITDAQYIQLNDMKDLTTSDLEFAQQYQVATAKNPVSIYRFEKLLWQHDIAITKIKAQKEKVIADEIKKDLGK